MSRLTRRSILGFIGFVFLAATWHCVDTFYGQQAAFRCWGLLLIGGGIAFCFAARIPIRLGEHQIASLEGWHKLYAIVPVGAVGLAVVIWPTEIACSIALAGYPCG